MTPELLEHLLYEGESSSLDYKRDSYPFENETDEKKSELLKDILAFANAWRSTDAYILIGVEDGKGRKGKIVGINDNIDDAQIQQFMKDKTQRSIDFKYERYQYENVIIGIISIPTQERPIHAKKDYGKVKKDVVYYRKGSSTAVATHDDVAKMGAFRILESKEPILSLKLAIIEHQIQLGTEFVANIEILDPPIRPSSLTPRDWKNKHIGPYGISMTNYDDEDYYEKVVNYAIANAQLTKVGFTLENLSGNLANGVILKARIPHQNGISIYDANSKFNIPKKMRMLNFHQHIHTNLSVSDYYDHWDITFDSGNVLPKATNWSSDAIYIYSDDSAVIDITAFLYAENLSQPTEVLLRIKIEASIRKMTRDDAMQYIE